MCVCVEIAVTMSLGVGQWKFPLVPAGTVNTLSLHAVTRAATDGRPDYRPFQARPARAAHRYGFPIPVGESPLGSPWDFSISPGSPAVGLNAKTAKPRGSTRNEITRETLIRDTVFSLGHL